MASQTANCFWLEHQHPNNVCFVFLCRFFLFWVLFPFLVVGPSPVHGRFPSFDLFLTCPPIIHPWQANTTDDIAAVKTILNERCIFQEKFTFQLHGILKNNFRLLISSAVLANFVPPCGPFAQILQTSPSTFLLISIILRRVVTMQFFTSCA